MKLKHYKVKSIKEILYVLYDKGYQLGECGIFSTTDLSNTDRSMQLFTYEMFDYCGEVIKVDNNLLQETNSNTWWWSEDWIDICDNSVVVTDDEQIIENLITDDDMDEILDKYRDRIKKGKRI